MAGLLGFTLADLSGAVDSRKRQYANLVRGLLSDPQALMEQLSAQDAEAAQRNRYTQASAGSVMPEVAQQGQQAMMDAALNVGGLLGITAYHGSPHKFDKFDMSKIGTGEGAQAYGHGLYFAENPAVADEYAKNLSMYADPRAKPLTKSGADKEINWLINDFFQVHDTASDAALKSFIKKSNDKLGPDAEFSTADLLNRYESLVKDGAIRFSTPNRYKVDIPDDAVAKMLDWDKPLSQQPEVLAYLQKNIDKLPREVKVNVASGDKVRSSLTGADLYRKLAGTPDPMSAIGPSPPAGRVVQGAAGAIGRMEYDDIGQRVASSLMRSLGIPGIRYLDAGSRGKGGTSNFVLFDDKLPKILSRE